MPWRWMWLIAGGRRPFPLLHPIEIFALVLAFVFVLAFFFAFATALVLALAFLLFVLLFVLLNPLELHPVCFSLLVSFILDIDFNGARQIVGLLRCAIVQAAAHQVITNLLIKSSCV